MKTEVIVTPSEHKVNLILDGVLKFSGQKFIVGGNAAPVIITALTCPLKW